MGSEEVQAFNFHIRPAKKEDMVAVASLIQDLADFQNMSDEPKLKAKDLQRDGFDTNPPAFQLVVAENTNSVDGDGIVGYALYFTTYSTWEGRAMMLEDLYVKPAHRRKGIGKSLFNAVVKRDGFDTNPPAFQLVVAENTNSVDGDGIVGYALYFTTYSTWEGRAMMLEDLYVKPAHRRKGIGKSLFIAVVKEASLAKTCRLDFHVLEWNAARSFYESVGAVNLTKTEQWCYYRLSGEPFQKVANQN